VVALPRQNRIVLDNIAEPVIIGRHKSTGTLVNASIDKPNFP
jgi:hypothetical protein